ncbi:unnamed protein product, partial [Cylicocyclus nassatus]
VLAKTTKLLSAVHRIWSKEAYVFITIARTWKLGKDLRLQLTNAIIPCTVSRTATSPIICEKKTRYVSLIKHFHFHEK